MLDSFQSTSRRLGMFSRFIGYEGSQLLSTEDASFFLVVLSCVLQNTTPGEPGKPATPPPASPDDEKSASQGSPARSVTPGFIAITQTDIMNGGSVLSQDTALMVANTVTAKCLESLRQELMQELMSLEEVSGNIDLDQFLDIMMELYLKEKQAATTITRALFLSASKQKQSSLTVDEFSKFLMKRRKDISENDAMDFYVTGGEHMNFEAFSRVMWKVGLVEFSFADLVVFPYYNPLMSASLLQASGEPAQYAKYHEYDERGFVEESWEVVRDIILYENRVVRTRVQNEEKLLEIQRMVADLDGMIRKIRIGEDMLAKAWKIYRLLIPVGNFFTKKRELLGNQADVAHILGDDFLGESWA
eukprot:CAMPEP_0196581708 /NCGR_PEP_ID=MMETSP1081-20130531/35162_1 /TAXON_ID=36882 /ORGANISM="Pyramimonas amylifera, Strain CCMP720" /LENGTH=359 /DNA_ID=CAMNT_0041902033 /DNA_START=45 /DNA_END=1124 /DNA_ORIENTATION=-